VISNFHEIRKDGKVIPEVMTAVQMITAGWKPDKVLYLRWESCGLPVELASPYGFLSCIVPSREYLVVLEDTDVTGGHARLSVYLPDGTLGRSLPNIVDFSVMARQLWHEEPGEYVWFESTKSTLPTAFGAVFKAYRNNATYRADIDAATGTVLGIEEVH
jgi:hypothetical protein